MVQVNTDAKQGGEPVSTPVLSFAKMAPALVVIGMGLAACTPTIRIEAPDKPIVINLNVKIDQEVRVRLEKDVEDLIANNPDIF
jgi:hypothetical protein